MSNLMLSHECRHAGRPLAFVCSRPVSKTVEWIGQACRLPTLIIAEVWQRCKGRIKGSTFLPDMAAVWSKGKQSVSQPIRSTHVPRRTTIGWESVSSLSLLTSRFSLPTSDKMCEHLIAKHPSSRCQPYPLLITLDQSLCTELVER